MLLNLEDGTTLYIHGSLASICGDTKGAHELFGFMSPSATKFCRLCHTSRYNIMKHSTAQTVNMRNRESHEIG